MGLISEDTQLWGPSPGSGQFEIPVLWITDGWKTEKQIIRNAIGHTWQKVSNVWFTGWETDAQNTRSGQFLRLRIDAGASQGTGAAPTGRGAFSRIFSGSRRQSRQQLGPRVDGGSTRGCAGSGRHNGLLPVVFR